MYFIYFCSKSMLMPEFVQLDVKVFDKFIEKFSERLSSTYKCNFLGADNKQ